MSNVAVMQAVLNGYGLRGTCGSVDVKERQSALDLMAESKNALTSEPYTQWCAWLLNAVQCLLDTKSSVSTLARSRSLCLASALHISAILLTPHTHRKLSRGGRGDTYIVQPHTI